MISVLGVDARSFSITVNHARSTDFRVSAGQSNHARSFSITKSITQDHRASNHEVNHAVHGFPCFRRSEQSRRQSRQSRTRQARAITFSTPPLYGGWKRDSGLPHQDPNQKDQSKPPRSKPALPRPRGEAMNCPPCDHGIAFPDGRVCGRHATPEQVEIIADLDRRAGAIGVLKSKDWSWGSMRAWPYGPNLYVKMRVDMLDWAEVNQLRLTSQGKHCLCWLRTGRKCQGYSCSRPGSWFDHVTGWQRAGQPALIIAQPYGVDIANLAALAVDPALRVRTGGTGWYGYGTVAIEIWRRDATEIVRSGASAA